MRLAIQTTIALVLIFSEFSYADSYHVDVWADNWFQLNIDGKEVGVDSVPITTERSFNAEQFSFTAEKPFVIGLIAKDFKENDSGLEYIGSRRQQMGDGGVILQIKDTSGRAIAVTDKSWKCLVVHQAPLEKSCANEKNPVAGQGACSYKVIEPPQGWDTASFDDTAWPYANEYSEAQVRPKQGYDRIDWDAKATLIWGPDLETDNTVLCRLAVQ